MATRTSPRLKRKRSLSNCPYRSSNNDPAGNSESTLIDGDLPMEESDNTYLIRDKDVITSEKEEDCSGLSLSGDNKDDSGLGLEKINDLWFEDGNIVLESQGRIFKVYSGFLEKHSTYFADLSLEDQSLDGVRLIHLPTSWRFDDVNNILMVYFYPNYFSRSIRLARKEQFLASLLIMAQRFGSFSVKEDVLIELEKHYPSRTFSISRTRPTLSEIVHIIHAARLTDYEALLPMAYYHLSFYPIEDIMSLANSELPGDPPMSLVDLTNYLVGRDQLIKYHRSTIWKLIAKKVRAKRSINPCSCNERTIETLGCSDLVQSCLSLPSVFHGLEDTLNKANTRSPVGLCKICMDLCHSALKKARIELWDQLPTIFRLSQWSVLLDELEG